MLSFDDFLMTTLELEVKRQRKKEPQIGLIKLRFDAKCIKFRDSEMDTKI